MSTYAEITDRNPFATRHVRPGAIGYCFPPGANATQLVARLAAANWRGEIVGPHGSGKSTLLATLIPAIEASGRRTRLITLHDGQRQLPERLDRLPRPTGPLLVIVDGYEQLGLWARWRLQRLCGQREYGLLVTAHRSVGLPALFSTATTLALAEQLVACLTQGTGRIDRAEILASFNARAGNLRELLFDCYDLYRRRGSDGGTEKISAGA